MERGNIYNMSTNEIPKGKYPEAFYRVSLKAIIENDEGKVLCVKEKGSDWTLPGGGIDHGEHEYEALARELYEEIGVQGVRFEATPLGIDRMYTQTKEAWMIWVLYKFRFLEPVEFRVGPDADEIGWLDPRQFKNSEWQAQQIIYKWCVDKNALRTN